MDRGLKKFAVGLAAGVVLLGGIAALVAWTRRAKVLAQLPEYAAGKDLQNLDWESEEPIAIQGYSGDAMEAGISPDGEFLLFNDRRKANKDMHWARRVDDRTYRYGGRVKNTVTPFVEGTPSFDAEGTLYFTTLKSYKKDKKSLYTAKFRAGEAIDPVPLEGDIYVAGRNEGLQSWISLDPDVSADGTLLFYSEGRFTPGVGFPYPFNIRGARKVDGRFVRGDDRILQNVNSDSLEYAPAISADGLELFFSRIGKVDGRPAFIGVFTARREATDAAFGKPERLMAVTGEVEAPSLSGDGRHLYYHRLDGGRFRVYRVTRKTPP